MRTHTFADATRVSTSYLAGNERRLLRWTAARLPAAINSDHLSGLALVSMLLAGLSYWLARAYPLALVAVMVWLAANWFGDSLDGTLARVRGHERPRYGFYVDHIIDAFGASFLIGGLGLSGYMSPVVAMGLLAAYLLLLVEVYLATYSRGRFRLSFWKLGPTELRLLLCLGNAVLLVHPHAVLFGRTLLLFDVGGLVAAAGLVVTAAVSAIENTRALYADEPLPRSRGGAGPR
jgi:phosphatidylglycerophosphate synthase